MSEGQTWKMNTRRIYREVKRYTYTIWEEEISHLSHLQRETRNKQTCISLLTQYWLCAVPVAYINTKLRIYLAFYVCPLDIHIHTHTHTHNLTHITHVRTWTTLRSVAQIPLRRRVHGVYIYKNGIHTY